MNSKNVCLKYIPEIDGLRALAVSLVIGFHYIPSLFPSGYIGVDIFFVISGFVISSMFMNWEFSNKKEFLLSFYTRRIKRLLPALIACILIISVLLLLITTRPSSEVFKTGATAILGISNLFLHQQSYDYFSLNSQLNPFMHTWSLGVEEQFYLLFPAFALYVNIVGKQPKELTKKAYTSIKLMLAVSFIGFIYYALRDESTAFFISPLRFWELLLGSVAYIISKTQNKAQLLPVIASLCLALIIVIAVATPLAHLIGSIISALTTALLLTTFNNRTTGLTNKILASSPIVYAGKLSYSLYLYHYPYYVVLGLTIGYSSFSIAFCLLVTIISAMASYHWLENPLRYKTVTIKKSSFIAITLLLCLAIAYVLSTVAPKLAASKNNVIANLYGIKPATKWNDIKCHGAVKIAKLNEPLMECLGENANGNPGDIFVLGDSHAAQLTFVLRDIAQENERNFAFINTEKKSDFPQVYWARERVGSTRLLEHVIKVSDPGDVLIVAFHRGYLNLNRDKHVALSSTISLNKKASNFLGNMNSQMPMIIKAGIKLILIGDTPLLSNVTTIETCALQESVFGHNSCTIDRIQDEYTRSRQIQVFKELTTNYPRSVFYFDPLPWLYGDQSSFNPISKNGEYLMIDWNHLSMQQASALFEPLSLFLEEATTTQ